MFACFERGAASPEPLAVRQLNACNIERPALDTGEGERLVEETCGCAAL
jgi:hypothetical protein